MPNRQAIHLKDYTPPAFTIDRIDLRFELHEKHTDVHSRMVISRNPEFPQSDLRLDGIELELVSIKLNGTALKAAEYSTDEESLTIREVPDDFILEIGTRVNPSANTSLMGLYRSNANFYTQCEAEGFRKITYFLDRPDVMAIYSTTIVADKKRYPVLLSNGNLVGEGASDKNRHWVKWVDPYRKPSYLFALVAGKLECIEDEYLTQKKRKVRLRIFSEPGNSKKLLHAMASVKLAMRWDEERFGLCYDLDDYMIVAVSDFNMGAMENKGLNIFNSKYVLATEKSATDQDFEAIESVIGHEYFHNWTGNRVTCRDWFQLSLKEGLTVFRDQEFSADMRSRDVKRIREVRALRASQFPEDAGPTAHPIRPESYLEISNFYTATVYSKGAEVIRMMHTLLGEAGFRRGMDEYFRRHDGQAVTCDDFVNAMEAATGADLSQFSLWYSQSGTPELKTHGEYDADAKTYTLTVAQSCPPTPGQPHKAPFHIPCEIGLIGADGADMPLQLAGDAAPQATRRVLEIRRPVERFTFTGVSERPVPSLLRRFSAPVRLEHAYSNAELAFLMKHDSDSFNRWEAGQRLVLGILVRLAADAAQGKALELEPELLDACRRILQDRSLDPAFAAEMLTLPSENEISESIEVVDPEAVHRARSFVRQRIGSELRDELIAVLDLGAANSGARALKNQALGLLLQNPEPAAIERCVREFENATNMTESIGALQALASVDCPERVAALEDFYLRWADDSLVLDKWFSINATSRLPDAMPRVKELTRHPAFDSRNPNKVRALIGAFAFSNPYRFHTPEGYEFLGNWILQLDQTNPQIASRLAMALSRWKKFIPKNRELMRAQLERIVATAGLSKDVFEIASKSLG